MIELIHNQLVFTFPEVHPEAELAISFQRTLRVPDDGNNYRLPPGLDFFPLKHVDEYAENVPKSWLEHRGVMLPMYQSEALWVDFSSKYIDHRRSSYPFAVKIATGKINAITGETWHSNLSNNPQDYIMTKMQPRLVGYCSASGISRQFVAKPLGIRNTTDQQIADQADHDGIQIIVYPMKRKFFDAKFPLPVKKDEREPFFRGPNWFCLEDPYGARDLAPAGRMKQEIFKDLYGMDSWDQGMSSRYFAHITNSLVWKSITDENPPIVPLTIKEYKLAGLPWFDYYDDDTKAIPGSDKLKTLESVAELEKEKRDVPLPENESLNDIAVTISVHYAFPAFIRRDDPMAKIYMRERKLS